MLKLQKFKEVSLKTCVQANSNSYCEVSFTVILFNNHGIIENDVLF